MGVAEDSITLVGRSTCQVGLWYGSAKIHASFDDPNLVWRAGLVPVMALTQQAGLAELAGDNVRITGRCGVNAHLKLPCLVAGMVARAGTVVTSAELVYERSA